MFDDDNDQYGFWHDEPTRPLERITARRRPAGPAPVAPTRPRPRPTEVQVGRRQHSGDNTQQLPIVSSAVEGVRQFTGHVDPLLRRMGAIAIVVALCVPVAMALRDGIDRSALQPDATTLAVPGAAGTDGTVQSSVAADGGAQLVGQSADQSSSDAGVQATAAAEPASSAALVAATTAGTTGTPPSATQPKLVEVATTAAPSCTKKYTVVAGDYWILIAKKVSITTKELLAANNASTSTGLYPGRSICLPANASAPTTVAPTTAPPTTVRATTTTVRATTTTTVRATTTTVAPAPPKRTYTKAEVAAIIRQVWPDNLEDEAVRIATRESNLVPAVRNFCCYGLFQIYYSVHRVWLNQMGVTSPEQLYDPLINAYVAYALYLKAGGWGPWKL